MPSIFLLELLAILLLVAAAVEPRWPGGVNTGVLVAVLDDSASMRAGLDGVSFRDKAREALLREVTSGQFRHVRLVLAGPQPAPLGGSLGSAADVPEKAALLADFLPVLEQRGEQQAEYIDVRFRDQVVVRWKNAPDVR